MKQSILNFCNIRRLQTSFVRDRASEFTTFQPFVTIEIETSSQNFQKLAEAELYFQNRELHVVRGE